MNTDQLDREVRLTLYDLLRTSGGMPTASAIGDRLGVSEPETVRAFERLATARVLVLEPDDHTRVRMANPFSGVPTPFVVQCLGKEWWGNCIWDALGIAAALDADARIACPCGDCGDRLTVEVRAKETHGEGVIHFAIPARQWWEDIIYT